MSEVSGIDVKLERKTFDIVLGTFSFMRDHFSNRGVVDPAALMMSKQEIIDMINKLKSSDSSQDKVTIPMNAHEWTVYYGLLLQTNSRIPQTEPGAYDVLDDLLEECERLDEAREN